MKLSASKIITYLRQEKYGVGITNLLVRSNILDRGFIIAKYAKINLRKKMQSAMLSRPGVSDICT